MKKRLLLLIIIIVMSSFLFLGKPITLEYVQSIRGKLEELVRNHYLLSVIAYILTYTLAAALSLPIAALLTITGGFLFGTIKGALFAMAGATAGATLAFIVIRYLFSSRLHALYKNRLASFYHEIDRYGFWYLLALRLIALLPFFLVTILAALTPIQLSTFITATALGIMPGALVFAYAGRSLAMIHSTADIFSVRIISIFILLALLALLPVLIRPKRHR